MILALDISLSTGYAYRQDGNIIVGTRCFRDLSKDNAVRGRRFRQWLAELMTEIDPSQLVIERPVYFAGGRGGATTLLHGLAWEAHRAAELRGIPRFDHAPISIKKFITGSGRASKSDVMRSVLDRGIHIKNDNEADAVALLLLQESGGL